MDKSDPLLCRNSEAFTAVFYFVGYKCNRAECLPFFGRAKMGKKRKIHIFWGWTFILFGKFWSYEMKVDPNNVLFTYEF